MTTYRESQIPEISNILPLIKDNETRYSIMNGLNNLIFVPDILPCNDCAIIIATISIFCGRKIVMNKEYQDILSSKMESRNAEHCNCSNCSLQFFITTNSYKYCMELSIDDKKKYIQFANFMKCYGFGQNYLISKQIINDKKLFTQLFSYFGQLLIDSKSNQLIREFIVEDLGRCLLYRLLTTTKYLRKNKHIRWILKYCNNILRDLLYECCQTVLNMPWNMLICEYRKKRNNDSLLCGISSCIDLIMSRIKKYNIYLYYELIDKYGNRHRSAFDSIPYHGYDTFVYVMVHHHHEEIHKQRMLCGNVKCGKKYMIHKYGDKAKLLNKIRTTDPEYFKNGWKKWKPLKVINKWYICSGCKMIYYCSRKCQKLSWNRQNHKFHCLKIICS